MDVYRSTEGRILTFPELFPRTSAGRKELLEILEAFHRDGTAEWVDAQAGWAVHHQALERLESEIKTLLEKFHRENPLRPGIPKEELKSRFPGLLLDIRMPGQNGIEVLREAKAKDPELSVIMVTAVAEKNIAKAALESGANDYVTKPIDLDYLQTTILVELTTRLN
jgi:CheY-like chemotaxis protein